MKQDQVAMRQGGVLYYIFGDHLGSTAVVKNTQGGKTELRYTAWGTTRYEYGSTPTDRRFTGQREEASLGLYFYNARWYDPALGRFIQADTIVPGAGNPQAWDRYAYANNNPLNYSDPTGHWVDSILDLASIIYDIHEINQEGLNWGNGLSLAADVAGLALPLITGVGMVVRAATHMDDAVDAIKVADKIIDTSKESEKLYTVYRSIKDGVVEYVGMTSDFVRRRAEHIASGRVIEKIPGLPDFNKYDARSIEQVFIDYFGRKTKDIGGTLSSINNSISPKRVDFFEEAIEHGKDLLEEILPNWRLIK